jgi:Na+-translocating ferredoxin:NAD+ oxidoreductase RnfD subunit
MRFLRTPKGLLLVVFMGLLAIACVELDANLVFTKVALAAATAAVLDVAATYVYRRRWILPDGAVLTGMIIAFVLTLQESWLVTVNVVAVAILCKHVLRTRWSNIANPAAFALVVAAIAFKTGQDWWGALPDLGVIGAVVVLAGGLFIANRINKLSMILAFFGAYFTLFTIATFSDAGTVAETFRTPDLQAALFFAFFMLDDPPTSPVRHEDQIVFGLIVAAVAYFIFMQFGGIYYLPAGLLAGNLWESARRLVVNYVRRHKSFEPNRTPAWSSISMQVYAALRPPSERLRRGSGIAVAIVAVALVATTVAMSVKQSRVTTADDASVQGSVAATQTTQPNTPYPFLDTFNADLSGTYSQSANGSQASLTVDAATTGDLRVKLHLELVTTGGSNQTAATVTTNKAQILDATSNAVLCDGTLTSFNRQLVQANCDGAGPYRGVRMTLEPSLNADSATELSGSLTGTMQRVQ